jgi:hypothetical protein
MKGWIFIYYVLIFMSEQTLKEQKNGNAKENGL